MALNIWYYNRLFIMTKRNPLINKSLVIGFMMLTLLALGICMGTPSPTINITGNDNYNVWGTVQNLEHSLHYVILVYGRNSDGKWYGPKSPGNDTFTEITANLQWKCNYNSDYGVIPVTAFKAYIIEKGVSTDEVLINGAHNISLLRAHVIAQTEIEKMEGPGLNKNITQYNTTI